jgi:hypothetical protein
VDRTDEAVLQHRKQTETSPMATKKQRAVKQRTMLQEQECTAIFEEVDELEDVAPRMLELLLTEPEGTRIYIRVRNLRTIN